MNPLLSIIIPCYKSASTLEETLLSVAEQAYQNWEALIINDGSPDHLEEIALKWVEKDHRFKYYKKSNSGLGSTRNFGVKKAKGSIILPLDSDNKIRPSFVEDNIFKFNENPKLGVVYGNAHYFGEKTGEWYVGPFDKYRMLKHNYIDACALIRKSTLEEVNIFEENLPYQGHEDWDLWLKIIDADYDFLFTDEIGFDYRVSNDSMIKSFDDSMLNANIEFIKKKHYKLYANAMAELFVQNKKLRKDLNDTIVNKIKRKLKKKL
jgi:glycosyltransferase involved in cell wall biosynthesis